jgi:hypothetical protein
MKWYFFILTLVLSNLGVQSQVLPGRLDVRGMPNFVQSVDDLVREAGLKDNAEGFESSFDACLLDFMLEASSIPESRVLCEANIFRYSVYIHATGVPGGVFLEAKSTNNSGFRFPINSNYDNLILKPLGPRDLNPSEGGGYILVPTDASKARKIFEFVGCRTEIAVQFRVKTEAFLNAGTENLELWFTVVSNQL